MVVFLSVILINCEKPEGTIQFTTLEAAADDISFTSALLKGEITSIGPEPLEDHGILISMDAGPSIENSSVRSLGRRTSKGVFSVNVTDLNDNTTYYFRTYIIYGGSYIYAKQIFSFTTMKNKPPEVSSAIVKTITMTSASLTGEVVSDGGETTTISGFCWAAEEDPTINNCIDTTVNSVGTGVFNGIISELSPGTRYFARLYSANSKGTSYSSQVIFKTHNLPVVETASVTSITGISAISGGNIIDDGGVGIKARGVCWDTSPSPTTEHATKTTDGSGNGVFVSLLSGLFQGTVYFIRAYATNHYGSSYGTEMSFSTSGSSPDIMTGSIASLTSSSVEFRGMVNTYGYQSTITFEYGLTDSYGEETEVIQAADYDGDITLVSAVVTGLEEGTEYHYRVKSVNQEETNYGNDVMFTTLVLPSANTTDATAVSSTSVLLEGIINPNGVPTEATFEYGLTNGYGSEIEIAESPFNTNTGINIEAWLSDLEPLTTYHYRIKAKSQAGITYGEDITFTTPGLLTDADGNIYNTVIIQGKTWMKENLKTKKYSDASNIPFVADGGEWSRLSSPGYCWYKNDETRYKDKYGAIYNWYVVNSNNICPVGWHVPTDDDWTSLVDYLGEDDAGSMLKATGTEYWEGTNDEATNQTGFTALPGGGRYFTGSFSFSGYHGSWWTTTESSISTAWTRCIYHDECVVERNNFDKRYGFSIRCVRD